MLEVHTGAQMPWLTEGVRRMSYTRLLSKSWLNCIARNSCLPNCEQYSKIFFQRRYDPQGAIGRGKPANCPSYRAR